MMLLVHDGKLHYEDRLTDVFPDFPEYGKSITIRNLLNHTSGLLDYEDLMSWTRSGTPPEQIPQIKDAGVLALLKQQTTTKFPPGTQWDYSNSGYAVLAMVAEKISGQPFGEFLHDRIFTPLGMKQTVAYEKGRNTVSNRAFGHTHEGGAWNETGSESDIGGVGRWRRLLFSRRSGEMGPCSGAAYAAQRGRDEAGDHRSQRGGQKRAGAGRYPGGIWLWLVSEPVQEKSTHSNT